MLVSAKCEQPPAGSGRYPQQLAHKPTQLTLTRLGCVLEHLCQKLRSCCAQFRPQALSGRRNLATNVGVWEVLLPRVVGSSSAWGSCDWSTLAGGGARASLARPREPLAGLMIADRCNVVQGIRAGHTQVAGSHAQTHAPTAPPLDAQLRNAEKDVLTLL